MWAALELSACGKRFLGMKDGPWVFEGPFPMIAYLGLL